LARSRSLSASVRRSAGVGDSSGGGFGGMVAILWSSFRLNTF